MTRTDAKIVCTLGPASDDRETLEELADAGMSVARLNASHGTTADRADVIDRVRAVDAERAAPVAVMLDLRGPEIRTAPLDDPVHLVEGSTVRLVAGDTATSETVGLSHDVTAAETGDRILIDDGRIETRVKGREGEAVVVRVESGGDLGGRKGVNLPGVELDLDTLTDGDWRELELAAEKNVDFVAASFVEDGRDVYEVSDALDELGVEIPVVAKVERAAAVQNLDGIVDAAYGVMVARGDLGVECPLETVPMVQKRLIRLAQDAGVPVITATEMLDSMVHARRPTRAEASDVANAVLDGTDAVMLSGETAVGDHPVRVAETMARIVAEVEESAEYAKTVEQRVPTADEGSRTEALARSARYLARDVGATAVVAASESGYTARRTAKFRPGVPVVATTPTDRVCRQLALSWGVRPRRAEYGAGVEAVIDATVGAALDAGVAQSGDTLVVLSGMMTDMEGANTTNTLKVHVAAEAVANGRTIVDGRVAGPVARTVDGDLSGVPDGAVLVLPAEFDGEFTGEMDRVAAIVDARPGMTGYPALVARELAVPMVSGAPLPDRVAAGDLVTLHAGRGVVYEGDVIRDDSR